jgi:ribosomal protein S18 acetylase RimI-like enzyme
MASDAYVRIYPENGMLRLLSNNGDCIEGLIEWLRTQDGVQEIELVDGGISDYTAPGDPATPGDEPNRNLYHYGVALAPSHDPQQIGQQLMPGIKRYLAQSGQACEVTLQG